MRDQDDDQRVPATSFSLDEYERAGIEFFSQAVSAVASADGVLSMISTEKSEYVAVSRNTLEDGETVELRPFLASSEMTLSVDDGISGRFDEIHVAIANAGADFSSQMTKSMLQHISDLCDATGNVVDTGRQSIWEAQLEALETVEISFGPDGDPRLPSLVIHPDTADSMGEPPEDFRERYEAIVRRRRDEWLAGRRTRRLLADGN